MSSKVPVVVLFSACAISAVSPAAAQQTTGESQYEQMQQKPSAQGGASDIERDPFRACVAAHPDDPDRQRNCGWDGVYTKAR